MPLLSSDHVVFRYGDVTLRREEIMSMKQTVFINIEIINIWSIILNSKEHLRAPDSPTRFFVTCTPTVSFLFCICTFFYQQYEWLIRLHYSETPFLSPLLSGKRRDAMNGFSRTCHLNWKG